MEVRHPRHRASTPKATGLLWPEPPQEAKDALPKDLDGRSDEARHGKAFEGLLKRYFGK